MTHLKNTIPDLIPCKDYLPASRKFITQEDVLTVIDSVLDMNFTEGRYNSYFQDLLAKICDRKYAISCNSGSSANWLAITALKKLYNFSDGDEVITVACGFPTTVNPILQNNLIPVFIDMDYNSLNIDANLIENAISPKTKAIIVAHTLGNPVDIHAIEYICAKYNLHLALDCCDSLGGNYDDKPIGGFGEIATFSFYPAHQIAAGEMGAVVTDNLRLSKMVNSLKSWGKSCFPYDTKVRLGNGSVKNISDIEIGDEVLTHLGNVRKVYETTNNNFTGEIYTIKSRMLLENKSTDNHPYFILEKNTRKFVWKEAKDLNIGDMLLENRLRPPTKLIDNIAWNFETDTKKNLVENSLPTEEHLGRLLGYYLSQGNLAKGLKGKSGYSLNKYLSYRVDFTFNKNKEKPIKDLIDGMEKYFNSSPSFRNIGNAVVIAFKSRSAYEFFDKFCSKISYNKKINDILFNTDIKFLFSIAEGFILGDGNQDWQGIKFFTTSHILLDQIRTILLWNGIYGSCARRTKNQHNPSVINGKIISQKHDLYSISFYGKYAEKLSKLSTLLEKFEAKTQRTFVEELEKYVAYRIVSIEHNYVEDYPVYNLEIKDDHSYHAGNIAVHNCFCQTGQDNACGHRFDGQYGNLPLGYDHKYVYSEIGMNLKTTDLQASLGFSQLKKLEEFTRIRRENYNNLAKNMKSLNNIFVPMDMLEKSSPCPFGYPIIFKDDKNNINELIKYLENDCKIGTRRLFAGNLLKHPAYKKLPSGSYRVVGNLKNTDRIMHNVFWVGVHPSLDEKCMEYIFKCIQNFCYTDFLEDE